MKMLIHVDGYKEQRECGSCNLCCTVMGVKELHKAKDVRCELLTKAGRCSVYGKHPASCQTFQCLWRQGILPRNMHPQSVQAVADVTTEGNVVVWHVPRTTGPSAWEKGNLRKCIDELGAKGIPSIIAWKDHRYLLNFPMTDEDVLLNEVSVDQQSEKLVQLQRVPSRR